MASLSHLKPGEKGRITATVDTANRKGLLIKSIDVMSNDTKRPKITLTLKAEVRELSPPAPAAPPH
jgi:multisubunit Na+/H+ antiporter MnhE subunit